MHVYKINFRKQTSGGIKPASPCMPCVSLLQLTIIFLSSTCGAVRVAINQKVGVSSLSRCVDLISFSFFAYKICFVIVKALPCMCTENTANYITVLYLPNYAQNFMWTIGTVCKIQYMLAL